MSADPVFVSYRRDEFGLPFARRMVDALFKRGYGAFVDFETVDSSDWEFLVLSEIPRCTHFLMLLTPDVVEECHDEHNWMRREYLMAVKHGVPIVPVLAASQSIPELRRVCPDCVRSVFEQPFTLVKDESFLADLDLLAARLQHGRTG